MFNIVLYEPQIPQNTGNIARSCAVTGAHLHLIEPLGFRTDEKALKRAGLTYWSSVVITTYSSWEFFLEAHTKDRLLLFSSKTTTRYSDANFQANDYLIFGREDAGVPEKVYRAVEHSYRIPMCPTEESRCLNLATSAGIVLYEALRQTGFEGLQ